MFGFASSLLAKSFRTTSDSDDSVPNDDSKDLPEADSDPGADDTSSEEETSQSIVDSLLALVSCSSAFSGDIMFSIQTITQPF